MRLAQGLPVNMIVLTALALLVLVVVGAFFISGFGEASGSVNVVNATQADCQGLCQELAASAFNYGACYGTRTPGTPPVYSDFIGIRKAREYACFCSNFGACTVTLRGGDSCTVNRAVYNALVQGSDEDWSGSTNTLCDI